MKRILCSAAFALALVITASAQSPYFSGSQLPDGVIYLPPPPDTTSIQFASDMNLYFAAKSLRNTNRGAEAVNHADGVYTHICEIFSPAFGLDITPSGTPAIYTMLSNSLKTTSYACSGTKTHYERRRPFQTFNDPLGTNETLDATSYPSSHSAKGWVMALLLIEINPAAQNALLKLGYEYGQSRVIVGAHWQSDVDAARLIGSSTYARLHTSQRFLQEMAAAQEEFLRLTHNDAAPRHDFEPAGIDDEPADPDAEQWYTITGHPATPATQGIVVSRQGKRVR